MRQTPPFIHGVSLCTDTASLPAPGGKSGGSSPFSICDSRQQALRASAVFLLAYLQQKQERCSAQPCSSRQESISWALVSGFAFSHTF